MRRDHIGTGIESAPSGATTGRIGAGDAVLGRAGRLATAALAVVFIAAATGGCGGVPFIRQVFFPKKIYAAYDLEDRVTLVLVDDPRLQLDDAALADQLADRVMNDLKEQKLVTQFVPLTEMRELRAKLGEDFGRRAINLVGQDLGAEQVLHVSIDAVKVTADPGVWHPRADVTVKLIDVVNAKRLFPVPQPEEGPRGVGVIVRMAHRYDTGDQGDMMLMMDRLAQAVGRDVAYLFYDHLPPQPGEERED